uniref:AB hydrolase-1 domain-containing protein n=1 Tax=Coccolithus braarudii TaxID=221442 RepID=A0A7S0L3I9_9EUKA|mmetsp:Transcript_18143/g.38971  ORF Transcript_18143/g.38971 Transcript_18143/m.38971 type:complete len:369 (+) Transcript_18143:28-1134(+)|eukprot:CAMPEP_0183335212 /NCGR_PEP_ID=MMETSP0164_2-20130417/3586_1 /TAXON_ID=221442 /ORGANISM="Coccolithus pelagicus ssp braarudi, Strain PLY182g" /LENGTH=368 /DNA_ID=CAMNT_0025504531 /DNA_START=28 /DNA_END=1134 /DNA_ORIENTATION=-
MLVHNVGRRIAMRNTLLAAATATLGPIWPAHAWCGEQVPAWAFFLKWDEVPAVPFEYDGIKGTCFCRVVGDVAREQKAGVPPILVVGDPGLGYDYIENIETLSVSDRRLIEVNFAGSQASQATPSTLLSHGACAAQLLAVVRSLHLAQVHVVAHGLGAPAALRLLEQAPTVVRSLALVSPYASLVDLRSEAAASAEEQLAKSIQAAAPILLPTFSSKAQGSCIADAVASSGGPLAGALLRGQESLAGEKLGSSLRGKDTPVLLANGRTSGEIVDLAWSDLPAGITRSVFKSSGHLPFIEERDEFLLQYVSFLDRVDGVETNRELKFADPIKMVKEVMSDSPVAATAARDCSGYKTDAARKYCETGSTK